jgi:hypothetical protein
METLRRILEQADANAMAVGHFNISGLVALKAVFHAARDLHVPVIVGTSEGERQFMGVRQVAAVVNSLQDEYDFPIQRVLLPGKSSCRRADDGCEKAGGGLRVCEKVLRAPCSRPRRWLSRSLVGRGDESALARTTGGCRRAPGRREARLPRSSSVISVNMVIYK